LLAAGHVLVQREMEKRTRKIRWNKFQFILFSELKYSENF